MDTDLTPVIIAGLFAILGALIAVLSSWLLAWCQAREARKLAKLNDRLAREREYEKEEREHKWSLQRVEAEKHLKPLLRPSFDRESKKCVFPHPYEARGTPSGPSVRNVTSARKVQKTDWYISVLVTNEGGSTAENCVGQLTKMERIEDGGFVDVPIHGPHKLRWAHDVDGEIDVSLPRGTDKPLNVVIASGPTSPLSVQLQNAMPNAIRDACAQMGEYVFTIEVFADDAAARKIKLRVRWDGSFRGAWTEDVIGVVP